MGRDDATAFRVAELNGRITQGSLALLRKAYGGQATLGWRMQSLWDSWS